MYIYVHSYARAFESKQLTLKALLTAGRQPVLVIRKEEENKYRSIANWKGVELLVLPSGIENLTQTRNEILEYARAWGQRFIALADDDLRFFARKERTDWHLRPAQGYDLGLMFAIFQNWLGEPDLAQVAMGPREGNNRAGCGDATELFEDCARAMRFVAFDLQKLERTGIRYNPVMVTKQDFDITLQLLRAGYRNRVSHFFVNDQVSSDAPGGCSVYRTKEMMDAAAHQLRELHPDFVTVVDKETKGAWGGGTRKDVRIQWKKAYNPEALIK